jgi:hypothetical protein
MKGHTRFRHMRRVHFFTMIRRATLAVLLLLAIAPAVSAADAPSFLIESIQVVGTRQTSIVIAESRLREGRTYSESELRDAMSRIQRLPFVIFTDFRLGKGSEVGRYVLIITIKQMKPFFVTASSDTLWSKEERTQNTPQGQVSSGSLITQSRGEELALGGRAFVGAKGVVNIAAQRVTDRNDRYTLTYSQYDLFGTRASLSFVASYLLDPGARKPPDGTDAHLDWHHRDNFTYEIIGVVPISDNDTIRGSWQRSERPIRYLETSPRIRFALISRPEIRREIFWIHDTTNDPLFPTSGTRVTVGGVRTSVPTAGFTVLGHQIQEELTASIERSWSVTSRQALTLGGSRHDFDAAKVISSRVFARYGVDLWGRERTIRDGDLRLEAGFDRTFGKVIHAPHVFTESTARLGLVYRNVWGIVRLDVEYSAWRQP